MHAAYPPSGKTIVIDPTDTRSARHAAVVTMKAGLRSRTAVYLAVVSSTAMLVVLLLLGSSGLELVVAPLAIAAWSIGTLAVVSRIYTVVAVRRTKYDVYMLHTTRGTAVLLASDPPRGHDCDVHLGGLAAWPMGRGVATRLGDDVLEQLEHEGATVGLTTLAQLVPAYERRGFRVVHRTWYGTRRMLKQP